MQELHNFNLNGRNIIVNEARSRPASGAGPRRGNR